MVCQIAKYRKMSGIKQEELAEIVGCTQKTMSKWENGVTKPDASQICDICNALDTTPNKLLGWEDSQSSWMIEDSYERRLIEDFRLCSPSRKGRILELAADNAVLSKSASKECSPYT